MCNCDPHKRGRARDTRGEFDWGGCSDNINYGIKFAKAFIDAKERTVRDARALTNLHNNRCGRTVSVHLLWNNKYIKDVFMKLKFIAKDCTKSWITKTFSYIEKENKVSN